MQHPIHHPVLLNSVLEALSPRAGESCFDGTAGYGGHAAAVLERTGESGRVVLVDRDPQAVQVLEERFPDRAEIIGATFGEAAAQLADEGAQFNLILLDLGVSSPQFDNAARGFSFRADAPLDMRMDSSSRTTAADIVNRYRASDLERIIRDYGEEPKARAVAAGIVAARPLATTHELARVVRRFAVQPRDIDAATRTFQALRIAVNDELGQLERSLPRFDRLLAPGGRLAIISFHSLEDRLVKQFFDSQSRDCICPPKQPVCTCNHVASLRVITKKPITATDPEIAINPRARSAKLRAAEKINQNKRRD